MISNGYHDEKVWKSILFQIMAGLYALQIKGIYIRNFTFEDNVYIKDLHTNDGMIGHWVYQIDGMKYHVPNYGYLVLIDSNYKDINKPRYTLKNENESRIRYKIESNIYVDDLGSRERITRDNLEYFCFKNFRNNFTPNIFGNYLTNNEFIKPGPKISQLLTNIQTDVTDKIPTDPSDIISNKQIIGYYIHKYMREYLHNRVGTLITETEKGNIIENDNAQNFKKGELILYNEYNDSKTWAIYLKNDSSKNMADFIMTKESPDKDIIITKSVSRGDLQKYANYTSIEQSNKSGIKLSSDDKLETYTMKYGS